MKESGTLPISAEPVPLPPPAALSSVRWYTMHMKRTNLVLDERLLKEATQTLAAKTYSAAVNTALAEVIRVRKIQSVPFFFGTGLWQGDLSQMREDRPARRRGRK